MNRSRPRPPAYGGSPGRNGRSSSRWSANAPAVTPTGPPALSEEHWGYWRREVLAYQSGLLDTFTGGLRPPICYLAADRGTLWLEDVAGGLAGTHWPVERYREGARHLGRVQGQFLTTRALPDDPWWSRDWLRCYLARRPADLAIISDRQAWADPMIAEWFPEPPVDELLAVHADQDRLLRSLDALPPTLSHLDLHPANLFDVGGATVLIDWASVGIAAVGSDAGNLVADSVLDFGVRPSDIDALDRAVFAGYLDGLADAGWHGPETLVRVGMTATLAAKYAWIAGALLQAVRDNRPEVNHRPTSETLAVWAPTVGFLLRQAQEARGGRASDGVVGS